MDTRPVEKLLIISNGHGEDAMAAEIARRLPKSIAVAAYPTLGEGLAYREVCPIVGPRRHLPSEGHRTRGSLRRDARAGFGIRPALRFMRRETQDYDAILVVGDTLGIFMCWLAGRHVRIYLDVYKSGYDNRYGLIEKLVLRRTAELVLTRDQMLAEQLQAAGARARFAGNPMMDTVPSAAYDVARHRRSLRAIAILPGSRRSMVDNVAVQLEALRRLPGIEGVDLFAVLARPGDAEDFCDAGGMQRIAAGRGPGDLGTVGDGRLTVHLTHGALGPVVTASDIVLGQGGTANLQAIGLGRPLVTFLAEGTTSRRAQRNADLAGDSRIAVPRDPQAIADALARLLGDEAERRRRGEVGRQRMGPPGAIAAIIAELTG